MTGLGLALAGGFLATLAAGPAPAAGSGAGPDPVDFDRHVAPLLGKLGCNAGACHGSFQGRGGLSFSLFGHDPARDYRALARDAQGRRVAPLDPDRSLVLLKGSGQIPHEGGRRFAPGSWEYQVIRSWIARGAPRDPSAPAALSIEVRPRELALGRPDDSAPASVVARFADGTEADVTPFCDLRVGDDAVAEILPGVGIRGLRPGSSSLVASYRGLLASSTVLVPTGRSVAIPDDPTSGLIDREVDARLRALGIAPASPADDATFLRRISLDVVGGLPTPDEVRAFLADPSPDKRARKVDDLLTRPIHAALWATRYLDITGSDVDGMEPPAELRGRRSSMWHAWFRRRFAENRPYDEIARGLLCATSRDGKGVDAWLDEETARTVATGDDGPSGYASKPSLDLFWRRYAKDSYFPIEQMAERTATALMGVRLECAQCHKHPFDRWTRADYRSYANVFGRVRFGFTPEGLMATTRRFDERRKADPEGKLPPMPRLREVYAADKPWRRLDDPETGSPLPPKALGGPNLPEGGDPRLALFAWLVRPDNPYFAPSFVNRAWAAYFGVGLVDPVDGLSVANPPSNARLLDSLAADFVAHGFDIRRLERLILTSRAYQRSAGSAGEPDGGGRSMAHAAPRPLMAEVLVDALADALGVPGEFGTDAPNGSRAIEVASNRVISLDLARAFRVFGRPERASVCDCERPRQPALPQALFLMTDASLLGKIRDGRLKALLESGRPDPEVVEELFLATLSRPPTADESDAALGHVRARPDRAGAFGDVLWALINTREFVLNH